MASNGDIPSLGGGGTVVNGFGVGASRSDSGPIAVSVPVPGLSAGIGNIEGRTDTKYGYLFKWDDPWIGPGHDSPLMDFALWLNS